MNCYLRFNGLFRSGMVLSRATSREAILLSINSFADIANVTIMASIARRHQAKSAVGRCIEAAHRARVPVSGESLG